MNSLRSYPGYCCFKAPRQPEAQKKPTQNLLQIAPPIHPEDAFSNLNHIDLSSIQSIINNLNQKK